MDYYREKGIRAIEKGRCVLRPYFSPFSEHTDRTQNYPLAGHLSSWCHSIFVRFLCLCVCVCVCVGLTGIQSSVLL